MYAWNTTQEFAHTLHLRHIKFVRIITRISFITSTRISFITSTRISTVISIKLLVKIPTSNTHWKLTTEAYNKNKKKSYNTQTWETQYLTWFSQIVYVHLKKVFLLYIYIEIYKIQIRTHIPNSHIDPWVSFSLFQSHFSTYLIILTSLIK